MSFTNSTENYGLPQWVGDDKPTFTGDFNQAFSAIDVALKTLSNSIESIGADNFGQELTNIKESISTIQTSVSELQTGINDVKSTDLSQNETLSALETLINSATKLNTTSKTLTGAVNELLLDFLGANNSISNMENTVNDVNSKLQTIEENGCNNVNWRNENNGVMVTRGQGSNNSYYFLSTGIYTVNTSTVGRPNGVTYGVILTFRNDTPKQAVNGSSWIFQLCLPTNGGAIYRRENINYTASGWTDWKVYNNDGTTRGV